MYMYLVLYSMKVSISSLLSHHFCVVVWTNEKAALSSLTAANRGRKAFKTLALYASLSVLDDVSPIIW